MALRLLLNGVDITSKVLWDDCEFEESADEGQTGNGTLVLRDIDASENPLANQSVVLYDEGNVAWRGAVSPTERGRDGEVDHVASRRAHRLTIIDQNRLFDYKRAESLSRSSETDVTRVRAAMATYRPTVNATTYVPVSGTVTMDAEKYRDRMLRDVIADAAEQAGKDYWIDRDNYMHYGTDAALSTWTASISLTDTVAAYPSDIVSQPVPSVYNVGDIKRFTDPNSIPLQNSILLKYGTKNPPASVTVSDAASIAAYGEIEGPPVYDQRAKSSTSATNRANALLARSKDPEVSYETTIGLPRIDIVKAGQFIAVTSQHQGLSATSLKIARMRAKRRGGSSGAGYWEVTLELARPLRTKARPKGYTTPTFDQAQVEIENCGSAITLSRWNRQIGEIGGDTGWQAGAAAGYAQWGCDVEVNVPHPQTKCGIGLGAMKGHADAYSAWSWTTPADSNQIGALMDVTVTGWSGTGSTCPDFGHAPAGSLCGTLEIRKEIIFYGGYSGTTPLTTDADGGTQFRMKGSGEYWLHRNFFTFGSGNRIVVGPGFHITRKYACVGDILNGPGIGDGGGSIDITIQMRCLADGTYGWIDAAPVERPDGETQTFTLVGGYASVARLFLNGVVVPSDAYVATDGSTIQLRGWTPSATDTLVARYYIPR